jgi:hypothetical protein
LKILSNFRFGIIEVLQHGVAAVLTAECHANIDNLHIRRLKPPLHQVVKKRNPRVLNETLGFAVNSFLGFCFCKRVTSNCTLLKLALHLEKSSGTRQNRKSWSLLAFFVVLV